jgi:hypothetical protein
MGTYLKMWMPTKQLNNKRLIKVDSIWNLNDKDIEFRGLSSLGAIVNYAVIEYNIIAGTKTEIYPIKGEIYLHNDWDNLPAGHKIYIRAYENNLMIDEDSIDTVNAPQG